MLLLSGIGPADELRALGIEVAHDLPGVGRNLQDHIDVYVISELCCPYSYNKHTGSTASCGPAFSTTPSAAAR